MSNIKTGTNKGNTSSQVARCSAVVYPYDNFDIIKEVSVGLNEGIPQGEEGTASIKGNLKTLDPVELDTDIISCSVTKDKSSPAGSFRLTLKQGIDAKTKKKINYLKKINSGDWICIYMSKKGEINNKALTADSGFKMLGIVDNVRYVEVDSPTGGQPRLEYIITGKDFGKVFQMDFFFNPIASKAGIETILGATFINGLLERVNKRLSTSGAFDKVLRKKDTTAKNPDVMILGLVDYFLGGDFSKLNKENQQWYIPSTLASIFQTNSKSKNLGKAFIDILDVSKIGLHAYSDNKFANATANLLGETIVTALPAAGNLWSMLQFLQNPVINEMYTELTIKKVGNKEILVPTLIMRQYPFSTTEKDATRGLARDNISPAIPKSLFKQVPRYTIKNHQIKSKNIGKSDFERINHIVVVPRILQKGFDIAFKSVFNAASIQRYGLKSLKTQTQYTLGKKEESLGKYVRNCLELLQDWFFQSHALYNGTIKIDGVSDFLQLGNNLYIEDLNQLFHIEGYTHTYSINPNAIAQYHTEINVSRGQILKLGKKGNLEFIDSQKDDNNSIDIVTSVLNNKRKK